MFWSNLGYENLKPVRHSEKRLKTSGLGDNRISYMGFRLQQKLMALNDLSELKRHFTAVSIHGKKGNGKLGNLK